MSQRQKGKQTDQQSEADAPPPRLATAEPASHKSGDRPRLSVGLALGSGVARGWAHIGVLRALDYYGIRPDVIAGTSIGAVIGAAYLAGQLDPMEDWARGLTRMRMMSYLDFKVRTGGMIGGRHLTKLMADLLGRERIEALNRPLVAVATDMLTGHEVWLRHGRLVHALRASCALPGVFPPVPLDGRWLVDGALVNPVPVSACHALGAQLTIAINLSTDFTGRVRAGSDIPTAAGYDFLNGMPEDDRQPESVRASLRDSLTRRLFRREAQHPSMLSVMFAALNIVTDRISRSRLAGDLPDLHIVPKLGHVGLFEFHRAAESIEEGEAAVARALPDIRDAFDAYGVDLATLSLAANRRSAR